MCFKFKQKNVKNLNRVRIILTSRESLLLEKFCQNIISSVKKKESRVDNLVKFPIKFISIITRKSPCGQGTNTWDHFETRIHKRVVDIISSDSIKDHFTSIGTEPGVEIEIKLFEINKK